MIFFSKMYKGWMECGNINDNIWIIYDNILIIYIYIDRNMSTVVNPMVLISLMAFCGLIMVMNNGYSGGYLEAC